MHKIWIGLAFAVLVAAPAPAQDYQKNFIECVKELGLEYDTRACPQLGEIFTRTDQNQTRNAVL